MALPISSGQLIRLAGVGFRSVEVACPSCRWSGLAGELVNQRSSSLGNSVQYACPGCKTTIAMHVGLTDQEVLQEMDRIRRELAEELNAHPLHPDKGPARRKSDIDVAAVRAQINLASPKTKPVDGQVGNSVAEQVTERTVVDEAKRQSEKTFVAKRRSATNNSEKSGGPDFAAVRARLLVD